MPFGVFIRMVLVAVADDVVVVSLLSLEVVSTSKSKMRLVEVIRVNYTIEDIFSGSWKKCSLTMANNNA